MASCVDVVGNDVAAAADAVAVRRVRTSWAVVAWDHPVPSYATVVAVARS